MQEQRLEKAQGGKRNKVDAKHARALQYTAHYLLPRIARRIDELHYENFNIPTLAYQNRVLVMRSTAFDDSFSGEFGETDYVDAREELAYEQIDLPFRTLQDVEDVRRLHKINKLFDASLHDKTVLNVALKSALTGQEYAEYLHNLDDIKEPSEIMYADGMPAELHDYNRKLVQADFMNAKYESMSGRASVGKVRFKAETLSRTLNRAESLYEDALLRLEEIYGTATPQERYELDNWMDREIDFEKGTGTKLTIDCEGIPRVKGSKSAFALNSGLPKLSVRLKQRETQLRALMESAFALTYDYVPEVVDLSSQNKAKLQALIAQRKSRADW